jgi:hypothetical protein
VIYDKKIDKTIVKQIGRTNTATYLELYRRVCKAYKRISRAAYDFHMKKLLNEKTLDRRDSVGRGKPIIYFLTAEAKQKLRLQILEHKSKKEKSNYAIESEEEKRQILYVLLFINSNFAQVDQHISSDSEEHFEKTLSEFGLTRDDLVMNKPYLAEAEQNADYDKVRITQFKNDLDIRIYKHEKPLIREKGNSFELIEYRMSLPGISLSGFADEIRKHVFEHFGFTREDLDHALQNLLKEGLLKIGVKYNNESRYVIVDKSLRDFINFSINLMNMVLEKMWYVWIYIRKHTEQERKWLQILHGVEFAEGYLKSISRARHSLTKRKKRKQINKVKDKIKIKEEEVDDEIQYLKNTYGGIINKYRFPSEKIIEILYPTYLQRSLIKQNI